MSTSRSKVMVMLVTGLPVERTHRERGDFSQLIRAVGGNAWQGAWLDVDLCKDPLPSLEQCAGVIVTGSPARLPDREAWMLRGEDYLQHCVGQQIPVLGICFGHQMLGQALGGQVAQNPNGREIGTVAIRRTSDAAVDPVFGELARYPANATHLDSVTRLPAGARVYARSDLEPHAAVRFADKAWGVQFHPEIDGEIMRHYIEARWQAIESEGLGPKALHETATDTPVAASVVERFVRSIDD